MGKKKNNNRLLKPGTVYGICVKKGYIIIDGKFFNFELDYEFLGLDVDGDTIKTLKDKNYVTSILSNKITSIKILGEIDKNYNHFLKDNKIYHINANYISIGKSKFTYEIANKSKLNLDLVIGSAVTAIKTIDGEFVVKNTNPIFVSENFGNDQEVTCPIKITGYYKEISILNKVRLNVIKGENKTNEIKHRLSAVIENVVKKIQSMSAYKNGKIVKDFIRLNPNMIDKNITKNPYNIIPNYNDILYSLKYENLTRPLGMLELYLFDAVNRVYFTMGFVGINQHLLSTKHCVVTPPVWEGDETISIMKKYEKLYKEIKKLYKIAGLLSNQKRI